MCAITAATYNTFLLPAAPPLERPEEKAVATAFVSSKDENRNDVILYYTPLEKNHFTKKLSLTCSTHHAHGDGCALMYPGELRHTTNEREVTPFRRTSSCPTRLGMWRPQEDGAQRLTDEVIRPSERESRDAVDPHWPGDIRTCGPNLLLLQRALPARRDLQDNRLSPRRVATELRFQGQDGPQPVNLRQPQIPYVSTYACPCHRTPKWRSAGCTGTTQ